MRKLIPKNYDEVEFNKLVFTQTNAIRSHLNLSSEDINNIKSE